MAILITAVIGDLDMDILGTEDITVDPLTDIVVPETATPMWIVSTNVRLMPKLLCPQVLSIMVPSLLQLLLHLPHTLTLPLSQML